MSPALQTSGGVPLPSLMCLPLSDGDQGTVETIAYIRQLVDQGVKDPYVNRTAIAIVRQSVPAYDFGAEVRAIYQWVLKNIRFTRDIAGKETLRSAREILTVMAGDCDDINGVLLPSLLGSIGHRLRLVTVSAHPAAPKMFSHIYAEVLMNNRWVPLDAARKNPSFGKGPERFMRKRLWSLNDSSYQDVSGLGFYADRLGCKSSNGMGDWSDFTDALTPISNAVTNIIRAVKTPGNQYFAPAYSPYGQYPTAAASAQLYAQPGSMPTWLPWAGVGLAALFLLRGR